MSEYSFKDVAQPGLMLSGIWVQSRLVEGETLQGLEFVLPYDFFEGIQIVDVPYAAERKAIGAIIKERNIPLTYCLARVLNLNNLQLASLDEDLRKKSVDASIRCIDEAHETEAQYMHVISGPAPEKEEVRQEMLKRMADSVAEICEAAAKEGKLTIIVEPLDVKFHKKIALGYIPETVELLNTVRASYDNVGMVMDTAHMILNGEDSVEYLKSEHELVSEFHFCNCIKVPGHPLYGDNHVFFGEPGELGVKGIGEIMAAAVECGYFNKEKRGRVFCEIIRREETPEEVIQHIQESLEQGWDAAQALLA